MPKQRRVELNEGDILVYKGLEIDKEVLEAITDVNKRLLWAFVHGVEGDVRAVPYSEEHVIWMSTSDVLQEKDVEV